MERARYKTALTGMLSNTVDKFTSVVLSDHDFNKLMDNSDTAFRCYSRKATAVKHFLTDSIA